MFRLSFRPDIKICLVVGCFLLRAGSVLSQQLITPERFGARADGKKDDTEAVLNAVSQATFKGQTLDFKGTYLVSQTIILENVKLRCAGKFLFRGTGILAPAFAIRDSVKITGNLVVDMSAVEGGLGTRAAVAIGNYGNGVGYSNIAIDTVTVSGGHVNMNGVLITGNSHDIRISAIKGEQTNCGRLLLIHWGNTDDHHVQNGSYVHVKNMKPTQHPHDIQVGSVSGNLTARIADYVSLVTLSAAYDVHIGEIKGNVSNTGGQSALLLLSAGDLGFAYATPAVQKIKMRNLTIDSVSGRTDQCGISFIGNALYREKDTRESSAGNYAAAIQSVIGQVNVTSTSGNRLAAVSGSNGNGKSTFNKVVASRFYDGIVVSNDTKDFSAKVAEFTDITRNPIRVAGADDVEDAYPSNITFGTVAVKNTITAQDNLAPVMFLQKCNDVSISQLSLPNSSSFRNPLQIGTKVNQGKINTLRLPMSLKKSAKARMMNPNIQQVTYN